MSCMPIPYYKLVQLVHTFQTLILFLSAGVPRCAAGLAERSVHGLRQGQALLVRRLTRSYPGKTILSSTYYLVVELSRAKLTLYKGFFRDDLLMLHTIKYAFFFSKIHEDTLKNVCLCK